MVKDTRQMSIPELIEYHSKRCPGCESTQVTTIDAFGENIRQRCLHCGLVFHDSESLPSRARLDIEKGADDNDA